MTDSEYYDKAGKHTKDKDLHMIDHSFTTNKTDFPLVGDDITERPDYNLDLSELAGEKRYRKYGRSGGVSVRRYGLQRHGPSSQRDEGWY